MPICAEQEERISTELFVGNAGSQKRPECPKLPKRNQCTKPEAGLSWDLVCCLYMYTCKSVYNHNWKTRPPSTPSHRQTTSGTWIPEVFFPCVISHDMLSGIATYKRCWIQVFRLLGVLGTLGALFTFSWLDYFKKHDHHQHCGSDKKKKNQYVEPEKKTCWLKTTTHKRCLDPADCHYCDYITGVLNLLLLDELVLEDSSLKITKFAPWRIFPYKIS